MKRLLMLVLALLAACAANASPSASANIIAPISLLNLDVTGLVFGQIVPHSGGTVTIAPDGTRSSIGVEVVPASASNAAHSQVGGIAGNIFSISLPTGTMISSGANSMTVDAFTSNPTSTGALDIAGIKNLNVGATLHVAASQPIGHYSGSFMVTVAYN